MAVCTGRSCERNRINNPAAEKVGSPGGSLEMRRLLGDCCTCLGSNQVTCSSGSGEGRLSPHATYRLRSSSPCLLLVTWAPTSGSAKCACCILQFFLHLCLSIDQNVECNLFSIPSPPSQMSSYQAAVCRDCRGQGGRVYLRGPLEQTAEMIPPCEVVSAASAPACSRSTSPPCPHSSLQLFFTFPVLFASGLTISSLFTSRVSHLSPCSLLGVFLSKGNSL